MFILARFSVEYRRKMLRLKIIKNSTVHVYLVHITLLYYYPWLINPFPCNMNTNAVNACASLSSRYSILDSTSLTDSTFSTLGPRAYGRSTKESTTNVSAERFVSILLNLLVFKYSIDVHSSEILHSIFYINEHNEI